MRQRAAGAQDHHPVLGDPSLAGGDPVERLADLQQHLDARGVVTWYSRCTASQNRRPSSASGRGGWPAGGVSLVIFAVTMTSG